MSDTLPTKKTTAPAVQPPHSSSPLHIRGHQFSPYPAPIAASRDPHLATASRQVYIYPSSSRHITFPLVIYTAAERANQSGTWPACHVAIAPHNAKPIDVEESLAPKGSQLVVVARLSKSKKTAPLSNFEDIDELREALIQLEIWDKPEPEKPAKNGNGHVNGNGHAANGADGAVKGGVSGKKRRGKT
ncbi:phosphate transporter (Pho88) [Hypoxylon texense]